MGAFEYQALDGRGRARKGVLQADTSRQARQQLRGQGLIPLNVGAVEQSARGAGGFTAWGRERALLLRQLSTLLKAGLPLEEALSALVEHAEKPALKRRLAAMRARVVEGQSLSAAMAEHPRLFPTLYTAAIAAGERAGRLDAVLARLTLFAEQRQALGRSLGMALIYPVLLTLIAFAVVWGLITFVVPRIIEMFDTVGQSLPWMTRSLIFVADFMDRWGIWLVPLAGVLALLAALAWRRPAVRARVDAFALRLPAIGRLVRAQQTARFTRTLAILSASGVPLVEALRVASGVVGNHVIRTDLEQAARKVREGASLKQSLSDADWLPAIARRLIASGEKSGELAAMLEHAAEVQERALEASLDMGMSILQPLLILTVGMVVLYIVLAIMLPILDLSSLVS